MWFWYQPFHTFIMTYVVGQNGQVFTPLFTDKNGMGGPVAHELSMYSDRIRYFPLKFSICVRQKLCELFKLNLFLFNFSILFLVLKEVVGSTVQSITEIFIYNNAVLLWQHSTYMAFPLLQKRLVIDDTTTATKPLSFFFCYQ